MRRFYAKPESFNEGLIELDPVQSNHLRTVLRLREGDEIAVFDGAGGEFLCCIQEIKRGKQSSVLKILRKTAPPAPESDLQLTLATALLKSDKFDLVVQKAVELGVTKLVPIATHRSDLKPKMFDRRTERFERIVIESSKQCGRATLMEISEPFEFGVFIKNAEGEKLLFSEIGGKAFSALQKEKKITALVGPEGGWETSEIESAKLNGFQIITLRGRILRAETAAIAISAIIQHNFGDLN